MERQQDYVLRTVEERGVRLIRLWFTDVLGQLKSFAISPAELENAFEEGMHFDGSAIDGFSRVQESDVLARPDPNTFELLPWAEADDASARMFCDIDNLDGTPFEGDPRQVLQRNLDRPASGASRSIVAPEMEFFYFADGDPTQPPEPARHRRLLRPHHRRRRQRPAQADHPHARGHGHPGGVLASTRTAPASTRSTCATPTPSPMADNVMTFRLVVREIAMEQGVYATFMPKPLAGVQGSGMHTHLSLFEGDANAFHDPGDQYGLSKVGQALHRRPAAPRPRDHRGHQPAGELLQAPHRRLRGARRTSRWARNNRSALVRVPVTKRGKESSTRIEYRSPDPACNPYLAYSVMLAAGLKGIEEGYELPPEATANIFELTPEERAAEGIEPLPQSLAEALDAMEGSELVAEALGEHIFEWFLRNKRAEWADYKAQVTPFELDRYLPDLVTRDLMEPLLVFPDPPPPELAQAARPRRLPVEGRRRRARRPRRLEPDDGWAGAIIVRRRRPRGRLRPVPAAAQARPARSSRCCCSSPAPSSASSSCATTSSTTSASRRSTPASSRPGSGTCSGGPAAAPGPSSSSTASWCSTSRPTRPRSTASRSTSPTWSTSC